MSHALYLKKCFDYQEQSKVIKRIKEDLKGFKFDAFIVVGISGIVMGSVLARSMRKKLTIIRKPGDGSHSCYDVENFIPNARYIFLDDLLASGTTFRKMKDSLDERNKYHDCSSKIVSSIMYEYYQFKKGAGAPKAWFK